MPDPIRSDYNEEPCADCGHVHEEIESGYAPCPLCSCEDWQAELPASKLPMHPRRRTTGQKRLLPPQKRS